MKLAREMTRVNWIRPWGDADIPPSLTNEHQSDWIAVSSITPDLGARTVEDVIKTLQDSQLTPDEKEDLKSKTLLIHTISLNRMIMVSASDIEPIGPIEAPIKKIPIEIVKIA